MADPVKGLLSPGSCGIGAVSVGSVDRETGGAAEDSDGMEGDNCRWAGSAFDFAGSVTIGDPCKASVKRSSKSASSLPFEGSDSYPVFPAVELWWHEVFFAFPRTVAPHPREGT